MKVWYNMCVKLAMAVCAMALAGSAAAKPLAVGSLGNGEYADTEVSTNLAFSVGMDRLDRVFFVVEFLPDATNELALSVGRDADGDGYLSADEADIGFGCDCGAWFSFGDGSLLPLTTNAAGRVSRTLEIPRKRFDTAWDTVRIARRGMGVIEESIAIDERKTHFSVRMR